MDKVGFKNWLDKTLVKKSKKYRSDLTSRAKRVELAFQEIDNSFSYDTEYKKDCGKSFTEKLSHNGEALIGTGIKLPIETNQIRCLKTSVIMYFNYLKDVEG